MRKLYGNEDTGELVYSSDDKISQDRKVYYDQKQDAPEIGSVFTAYLCPPKKDGGDLIIGNIRNYTGYVKPNSRDYFGEVEVGKYYRMIVTAVHHKSNHNYFWCVPFRKVGANESKKYNLVRAENFLKIRRLAEWFVGFGEESDINKILYSLKDVSQK